MVIENLFPLPIGISKYEETFEKEFLRNQTQISNEGNSKSENSYILECKEVLDIRQYIEKSLHQYFMSTYNPKNDVRLRITQSWLNWTKPGQYHHKHIHQNSLISGVFYVDSNRDMDKIYFFKNDSSILSFPPIEYNSYNSQSWWFPVGSGDLILFPSYLSHMVQTVDGDDTRLSLAFNTFPVGDVGDEISLSSLKLGK